MLVTRRQLTVTQIYFLYFLLNKGQLEFSKDIWVRKHCNVACEFMLYYVDVALYQL